MNNSNRSFIYCAAVICCLIAGLSGIGLVWMRQQISRTADRITLIERELADVERRNRMLDTRIAEQTQPARLEHRVASSLRKAREDQIVYVRERYLGERYQFAVREPFEVTTGLALLEVLPPAR